MIGLRLHFHGFTTWPPTGDAVWQLQVDNAFVGFVIATSTDEARAKAQRVYSRGDWVQVDPIGPSHMVVDRIGQLLDTP